MTVMMAKTKHTPWRELLPIHPAALLFPRMTPAELQELAKDIEANGLTIPVAIWSERLGAPKQLLDGINRLDAVESLGWRIFNPDGTLTEINGLHWRELYGEKKVYRGEFGGELTPATVTGTDPYAYVIAANIRRRHLTSEQKRELIAHVAKENSTMSHRAIAKLIGVDHKTVADVRTNGEIPQTSESEQRSRAQLGDKRDHAIAAIEANPNMTATALAAIAGVSDKTISKLRGELGIKTKPGRKPKPKPPARPRLVTLRVSAWFRKAARAWEHLTPAERDQFRDHINKRI